MKHCEKCGSTSVQQGAPHSEGYTSQWECLACGHIEPVYVCPHHKGEHQFLPCDEWPATCWCGAQQ